MAVEHDHSCMPLVRLPHMMRAIREGMPTSKIDLISGLPKAAQVILCIAVALSQVWGPSAGVSITTLREYCVQATHHSIMDELSIGHISLLVGMLVDADLLATENYGRFNHFDVKSKLQLGAQLDEVEIALEKSLLKEGFYASLVEYVKRTCPNGDEDQWCD